MNNRISDEYFFNCRFDKEVELLRAQKIIPSLSGSTDIYPNDHSLLIASGNTWTPRPVVQSYSAYTKFLANVNIQYLLSDDAPVNLAFKVDPIDWRLPSGEDGVSWPVLLHNYKLSNFYRDNLILKKKNDINTFPKIGASLSASFTFGEEIPVPNGNDLVFVRINFQPTNFGRVANVFYKTEDLTLHILMENETALKYRLIPDLAAAGFIVSPLIRSTYDLGLLFGGEGYLGGNIAKSIRVETNSNSDLYWRSEFKLEFSKFPYQKGIDLTGVLKFDRIDTTPDHLPLIFAQKCLANIDFVAGSFGDSIEIYAKRLLRLGGWLASDIASESKPEAVYLVLTDKDGFRRYISTHASDRPDVGIYFRRPSLSKSGFVSTVDLSTLAGKYTLGLAFLESGKVRVCPEFKIPTEIDG